MKRHSTKLYHWALEKASSKRAPLWLALLFGLELFLIIPLDAVMMFFCLQKRSNIFLYIMIATIASTISGLVGYLLGHFLWDLIGGWVVPHLITAASFAKMAGHIQMYENWAVFISALFPLPLKAISLVSGVFHIEIVPFITCIAIARMIRFSLTGVAMAFWGEKVKAFVDRHFHSLFMILGAKIAAALVFFWVLAK
ncbi:MAG: VTT domain-containing protein [Verrucomicrobia bacterium]|nr:VTT domain-containing protein [Verrucomicrobiota bacterium]MBU6446182.1 VTT domain-containing protein [Verrucomicrobiota bacterium]MDE3046925.1 VTT domain-containing protein [Verrucomicrobiota bacterium]